MNERQIGDAWVEGGWFHWLTEDGVQSMRPAEFNCTEEEIMEILAAWLTDHNRKKRNKEEGS